jgi:hypothetical protein
MTEAFPLLDPFVLTPQPLQLLPRRLANLEGRRAAREGLMRQDIVPGLQLLEPQRPPVVGSGREHPPYEPELLHEELLLPLRQILEWPRQERLTNPGDGNSIRLHVDTEVDRVRSPSP